ncbi:MAG: SdpI/YhfL protein family [Flavobacteriaceae bacterium]|nr:SdpI/YhfL protein family [Flavobacteriaceae bacterium]|tara:strand:- start:764 stop:1117 length:354 start_codon:yes stop_codon:yes gene_type:complete
MSNEQQLWFGLGYLAFMVVLLYLFKKNPPKKINWLYGYRTRRSMANKKVWHAANKYSLSKMFYWQVYCLPLPVIGCFLYPAHNLLVTLIIHTVALLAIIPATEIYLNKHFDKNGNPK